MNWDRIEGNWKQFTGKIREKWGKLTGGDMEQIAGRKDNFLGKLQEKYGLAKEEAQRQLDSWLTAMEDSKDTLKDSARDVKRDVKKGAGEIKEDMKQGLRH